MLKIAESLTINLMSTTLPRTVYWNLIFTSSSTRGNKIPLVEHDEFASERSLKDRVSNDSEKIKEMILFTNINIIRLKQVLA